MRLIGKSEAISLGLKRYFTGKPCGKGHVSERYTSGHCIICTTSSQLALREKHPDRAKDYCKKYREKNPEKAATVAAKYRESHRSVMRERTRQWRLENKEKCKKYVVEFREKFPERVKGYYVKYRSKNREKVLLARKEYSKRKPHMRIAHDRNRRARHVAALGSHGHYDVLNIIKMQRERCAYCRVKLQKKYHVDHIVPLSKGGSNFPSNLQVLCPPCNQRKYTKDPIDFAREMGRLL